jgi:hypothetical protein
MRQDPWLGSLYRGGDGQSSGREQLGGMHRVEGIPLEVIELAGRPGEVVIAHLHVFHSVSANASSRPRQMLSRAIFARKPD